ncbi:N6-adenosine-methyltransferase mt-a70-like [Thalictrum thalictroides]|uniref:N6-adenosine-methyltransferase mt-a70-like n=1 Tax=Thalictrum thalictroides TaxID=46969 RepID=A0A7J6WZ03_THATH|nr:N6-adenosine-methyltransferase mt-a70-like [Thalictrum thalictroides]
MALRSMSDDKSGVELGEFLANGKSRVMVLGIDQNRLVKELPEGSQHSSQKQEEMTSNDDNQMQQMAMTSRNGVNRAVYGMGGAMQRHQNMWLGPNDSPMFSMAGSPGPMMVARGEPRGMGFMGNPLGMGGIPPLHRPPLGTNSTMGGLNSTTQKPRSEEDDIRSPLGSSRSLKLERSFWTSSTSRQPRKQLLQQSSKAKEYCTGVTKEDCRRQSGSYVACGKVQFRWIIAQHTEVGLGDCSFLDTCCHMKTCKFVHCELDPTQDVPAMMIGGGAPPPTMIKSQRAEYCSEVELGEPQWINCDIRSFRMDILGQFGIIMADPPWDIHMELPYGTMADEEMKNLNVPALQTDGLIFLWVTGRAMELGCDWFKAAYPDVEVKPPSPPRTSTMDIDSNTAQTRSPFLEMDSKSASVQPAEPMASEPYGSGEKTIPTDVKMEA